MVRYAVWRDILDGKYKSVTEGPERVSSSDGKDIMSIPNDPGMRRQVYERTQGGSWTEVPDISRHSDFAGVRA